MRLMEVLLHGGSQLAGWRTAQIHEAIQAAFDLPADAYTVPQLRYDLRKMRGHGLLECDGKRYSYQLTEKGSGSPPCSSSSISASAARWRIRYFIIGPSRAGRSAGSCTPPPSAIPTAPACPADSPCLRARRTARVQPMPGVLEVPVQSHGPHRRNQRHACADDNPPDQWRHGCLDAPAAAPAAQAQPGPSHR